MTGGQPTPGPAGDFQDRQTIQPDGDLVKGGLVRFELGSEQLNDRAKWDLEALLPVLERSSNKIKVEGYVSPAEEEDGTFSRGIYLANARAIEVTNYLIELGLRREYFEIGISSRGPNRAVLPPGSNPRLAGASAAVYLINGRPRPVPTSAD